MLVFVSVLVSEELEQRFVLSTLSKQIAQQRLQKNQSDCFGHLVLNFAAGTKSLCAVLFGHREVCVEVGDVASSGFDL